ncbi:hypothetical protein CLPUN_50870 [Clostridium puniceum]|uniref:Phage tail fibre protein N-terminal domain-containing protein n=1 Tax=Clostridium puniceum TaxID=29367 RepID=A0A1S8T0S9_9CLOT|nr:phage tail protein [Clostridium puniceum]OOM71095.1 hypothetical protein CLPUN_50870 [Clostridium puniceum]
MAENFYTILTSTGKAKLANSAVLGSKVNFKTLKVGDGKGAYYEPSENQTSLVNQVWSGNIGSISVDENNPNWIVIETLIPATIGGFFIREAGIFDEDDELIAISKLSETYKPVVSEGSIKDLCIKIILEVSNVESVTLKIDPTVIVATRKDIDILEAKVQDVNTKVSKNTQDILDLNTNKANITDSNRTTTAKDITGAINELNSGKANKDGLVQKNLNADLLDGLHSTDIIRKYDLNSINIDITDGSWYTSISETGHGTTSWGGWVHVIQYATPHFYTQIANTVNSNPGAVTGMAIRTKWLQSGVWTQWRAIPMHQRAADGMNADNLTDTGMYSGSWGAGVPTEYPGYYDNQGVLQVVNYWNLADPKWVRQIFYTPHNDLIFERARVNGVWLKWKPLNTTETTTITQFYNGWSRWSDVTYGTDLTKSGNLVNLSILVISSSPNQSAMFYLPEGYRPRNNIIGTAWGGNKHSEFRVYKDGTVAMNSTPTAQTWHSIQVTFSV